VKEGEVVWGRLSRGQCQPHPLPSLGELHGTAAERSAAGSHVLPKNSAEVLRMLFISAIQKCFLATEIESSFGQKFQHMMGMSEVLCSFILFLKPGFLQTDICTCLLYNIGMGFMKSP